MPLKNGYSQETFDHNVGVELGADRPKKQALAIAFAKRREAMKRKKMWRGGYAAGGQVAPDDQADDLHVTGHLNTSGEPHTEDEDEVTHPMEFMSDGGVVETDNEDEAYDYGPENYAGESTMDVTPGDAAADFYHAIKRRQRRFGG